MLPIHAISISSTSNSIPVCMDDFIIVSGLVYLVMHALMVGMTGSFFIHARFMIRAGFQVCKDSHTPERHDGLQVLHDSLMHVKLTRPPKTLPSIEDEV
jgi:hypothetical protein